MNWLISILFSLFGGVRGGSVATQATGGFNTLATWSALGAAGMWVLGPGRALRWEFNLLELAGLCLAVNLVISVALHQQAAQPRWLPPPS